MKKSNESAGGKIRVLIVDDHAMVRQGLRTFLELQDSSVLPIEIAGEASNGIEAVELLYTTGYHPADLLCPEMDGIQATSKIIECSPRSRHHFDQLLEEIKSCQPFAGTQDIYSRIFRRMNWFMPYVRLILARFNYT
jgi:response regulator RpfG family c-di-GMP phosphodiesterase